MNNINTDSIPDSDQKETVYKMDGTIDSLIDAIMYADSLTGNCLDDFSLNFSKDKKGLEKLWKFVKEEIKYKPDQVKQCIQLPSALWKSKTGDSKSKTLFVNTVLKALGVKCYYKFVSFGEKEEISHVYTIAILENGTRFILDTSTHEFNFECSYVKSMCYFPNETKVSELKIYREIKDLKASEKWAIPTFINLLQNGVDKQIITPNQLSLFKELLSEKLNNNER